MKLDPLLILAGFAGLAFGWVWGFAFCLTAIIIGTGVNYLAQRKLRAVYRKHMASDPSPTAPPTTHIPGGYA